jgi:2-phosphoglycolate phosphatase
MTVRALLFDLDGTLIDSAPDLAASANEMRVSRGAAPLPDSRFRPMVGAGARGMIEVAMAVLPGEAGFDALRDEFLAIYARRLLDHTRVFDAMQPVLHEIEAMRLPWGIVTNKAERFTIPVVEGLGLHLRAAAVVCGDTTPHAKPHPAPLLEAARRIGIAPDTCWYIGDDLRDVLAGRAAGMRTAIAAWGYLGLGEPISTWGADLVIEAPHQILKILERD